MPNPLRMSVSEFRTGGYLQEVNRTCLHPLGLALMVRVDGNGRETIVGIQDCRDDPEGILYDLANSNKMRIDKFNENKINVDMQRDKLSANRIKQFGSIIEPIPTEGKKKNE